MVELETLVVDFVPVKVADAAEVDATALAVLER
jgi:hypothetical protein